MPPQTHYVTSGDAMIAYQVLGEGPIDLVYISGATSHVDVRWESRRFADFIERLTGFARVILFDRRGSGASDPLPTEAVVTWEAWAEDLRVVLDEVGSTQAAVFATLDAGPIAMVFAATYPDRVRALVLGNTTACMLVADDNPHGITPALADALISMIATSWGTEEFVNVVSPGVGDERQWFARYMRSSVTPRAAAAQMAAMLPADFRSVLPLIRAPVLLLHSRDFGLITPEHSRYMADRIPDAKYVEVPSADSALFFDAAPLVLDAVEEFLTGAVQAPPEQRVLATVVFTDIVGSTQRAADLGDRRWRVLLERHDEITRRTVEADGGRLWKSTGDGALATYDVPGRAIRSMLALRSALEGADLPVRIGIHAGEVELRGDDLSGLTVHIAARVLDLAGAGEVLVSRTVADLVAGSGLRLTDRGTHLLKGVPGEWGVHQVESGAEAS